MRFISPQLVFTFALSTFALAVVGCGSAPTETTGSSHLKVDQLPPSDPPDADQVHIDVTSTGCEGIPVTDTITGLYDISFDDLAARRESGAAHDVDCKVTLTYSYPAGFTLDAPSVIVQGYTQVDDGVAITLTGQESMAGTATAAQTFGNGFDGEFDLTLPATQAGKSECGATSTTVTIGFTSTSSGDGVGLTQVHDLDGTFQWHRCP
jgi:hypothetical protein